MASGQIRMTPENMRTKAGEYKTQAGTIQDVIEAMDRLLGELQDEWEGSASEAYADKFADLRPGFLDAKDLIEDIAEALTKTANAVEQADEDIANQFRA